MHDQVPFEERLRAARAGDRRALELLLARAGARVRLSLRGAIPRRHQAKFGADDVMQRAYVKAMLLLPRFKDGGEPGFSAWLRRLARNSLLDMIKSADVDDGYPRHRPAVEPGGPFDRISGRRTTPSRALGRAEDARRISRAVRMLPADQGRAIRLRELEERSLSSVCAELRRSEGAVHMLLARARARLRELLGESPTYCRTGK